MNPIQCFENSFSGALQICLEKEGQKIGNGSGFLIDDGIITNSHVIRAADFDAIAIRFNGDDPLN